MTFTASRANKEQSIAAISSICSTLGVEDERLAISASIRINRKLHGDAYVPYATEASLTWALIAQDR
ncbi:hypothetical protein MY4038_002524 [Beauveria bassiana]